MIGKMDSKIITAAAIVGFMMVPATSYGRVNSLVGGLATFLDFSDRTYDPERTDTEEYRQIGLRPSIDFNSSSEKDNFRLRAAPNIQYDFENSEADWNSNVNVAADRFIYQSWQLGVSDTFLRSDYYDEYSNSASQPVDPSTGDPVVSDPTLSTDLDRRRYSRNTLNVFSNHFYRQDSLFRLGFNYIALRNDDSGIRDYDDYDRYAFSLLDEHRFNPIWKTTIDFNYIIGDYEELLDLTPEAAELSRDLKEYRLLLSVENDSIRHNPLTLNYYYIDTDYDQELRSDVYIHQMRAVWRRDYSPHLYTRLGAGPSYGKAEGSDANWGGNGVAEINYLMEHGFVNFTVDKRYEVQNFSGNYERGATDTWDSAFSFQYQLLEDLRASGSLTYIYEDRDYQFSDIVDVPDSYHTDRYIAGAGLGYSFWRFYTASVDYTYINQDSERVGDTYDDHRILLTLSWQKELYRW